MTSQDSQPHISINAQYIKDFSFENPSAPISVSALKTQPQIDLALDINISKMPEEGVFEVVLHIEASAKTETISLFVVDLQYAGIFSLINIPEDQQKLLLAIHCPAMIFPFARKIIADVTQDGGFQPLMIDPIDFGALFHKKMIEEEQKNK
jgi:preprotein translocase subunit SecB